MAKTAIPEAVRRGETFVLDPDDLTIITDPSDPFYDPRSELPLDSPESEIVAGYTKNAAEAIETVLERTRDYMIGRRAQGGLFDGLDD